MQPDPRFSLACPWCRLVSAELVPLLSSTEPDSSSTITAHQLRWEKVADKLRAIGATTKGLKKKLATWAKEKGLANSKACLLGGDGVAPFAYGVADKASVCSWAPRSEQGSEKQTESVLLGLFGRSAYQCIWGLEPADASHALAGRDAERNTPNSLLYV